MNKKLGVILLSTALLVNIPLHIVANESIINSTMIEQQPVHIPDKNFKGALNEQLNQPITSELTRNQLATITSLSLQNLDIHDLTGAEYLENVAIISLEHNKVSDLSPLQYLSNLLYLDISDNNVSDLSPLTHLQIAFLNVDENNISDVSPIASLRRLDVFSANKNTIATVDAIASVPRLRRIYVNENNIADLRAFESHPTLEEVMISNQRLILPQRDIALSTTELMIQNPIISFSNNSDQQLISDSFSFYGEQGIANYPEIKQFIQLQTGETAMYSGQIIQPIRFSQSPTFTGITDSVIKVGEMFDPLAHVHAHDAEDGDITKNIVVSGTVDTMKSGVYVLTYSVTDSVGNLVEVTRTITVRQELISIQTIPTLTFIQKEISLKVGDRFDASMWITVSDPLTDIEIIENTVNTAVPGRYAVTYRVTGLNGSSSTATLIVNVDDLPTFTGITDSVIKVGEIFDPLAHVHAHDAEDGDITKNIVVSGTVDTMKSGVYVLTYSVTDSVGNLVEVTRTITVRQELISIQTIPTLTFIQKEISLKVGDRFDASMWITVSDPLTDIEIIENTVNTAVPGRYAVTYRVTGLNGSSSTATLIVNVDRRNNPTENTNSVSDESILIVESEETQTTKTNNSMTPLKEKEVTLLKTGFEVFELSLLIGGVAVIASLLVTKNKRPYLDNNKTDTH